MKTRLAVGTLLWFAWIAMAHAAPVTVDFDNPSPSGSSGELLNDAFQGINFGAGQWRWESAYGPDPTNHIFFSDSVTSRSFTFAPAPRRLTSFRAFTFTPGTLTATDNVGQTLTRSLTTGSMQTVTTGWTQGSTTVTISFTAGWDLGVDDMVHDDVGPPDTVAPTATMTAPADSATVSGTIVVLAAASDAGGVAGVQFLLDGQSLGAEDTVAPYALSWNTTTAPNGPHTLSARARDAAGNLGTSSAVTVTVSNTQVDGTPPSVSLSTPAPSSTVSGMVTVAALATDNVGVVGVQFTLDGANLQAEDLTGPYEIAWDTSTAANGSHTVTATARDDAGNQATATPVTVTVLNGAAGAGSALRFYGNGVAAPDLDRVKIRIDDPATTLPGPPADIGATDFTLELWLRGLAAENGAGPVTCGANIAWINGNIVVDRDRFEQPRKFGLSLAGRRPVFGVTGTTNADNLTLCSATDVLDNAWHHLAVQRRRSDGWMWLYVDGALQAQANGPDGDISYPDDGVPGNFCNGPCTNSDPFLVLAAEKHDAGPQYPSFSGWLDEVRLSTRLRYAGNFQRPTAPFSPDPDTAALYHFNEGSGETINDISGAPGGPSSGMRRFGGNPAGPVWVLSDAPLGGASQDTVPPTVAITAPAPSATVSGTVEVSATASDAGGVAGVQFLLDGANLGAEDTTAPYALSWNTTTAPNGPHTLSARARDAVGNQATASSITVSVNNPPPPVTTTVTFDAPAPPGGAGALLNGLFEGIDFGTDRWRWGGPFGPDATNNIFFDSGTGTSRSFTFAPAPRRLVSVRVFAMSGGTLTLSDNLGQSIAQAISVGSMQMVTTGWPQASTTVTVAFTSGWDLGVDDLTHGNP